MMKNSSDTMLDLSFLTDEEYEKLMKVLQRDADLQKKDHDRIRLVQGSIRDEKKKKFVTGEWFHDVKSRRFQEDLQGPDLLRASIRKKSPTQNSRRGNISKEEIWNVAASADPVAQGTRSPTDGKCKAESSEAVPRLMADSSFEPQSSTQCVPEKKRFSNDIPTAAGMHDVAFSATDARSPHEQEQQLKYLPDFTERAPQHSIQKPIPLSRKTSVPEKSLKQEASSPSKIPVKRKTSKEALKPEVSPYLDKSGTASGHSTLSSPDVEPNKNVKTSANFEVHSIKEMQAEPEPILDKGQFMSLKKFWEKGTESSGNAHSQAEQEVADMRSLQQPPTKPARSLPLQSSIKSNNEERSHPEYSHRIKHVSQRIPLASSSEDEMVHVAPPRKSSSFLPRSTYAKSKGSALSKSVSLSESNGLISHSEDSSGTGRSSKKSKLPVRVSPAVQETKVESITPEDKLPKTSEPEILDSVENIIVPEIKPEAQESLHSRVQILIDTVSSDEEHSGTKARPKNEETVVHTSQEMENDRNIDDYPTEGSAYKSSNVGNARSMVNIYTTTETYSKPNTLSHQLLEPERAKELSRSTPALHSETESDTASEISFKLKRHRKTQSNGSNSSDMASVSSVSNSVLSVYSGDFGSVDAQGSVQFSLDYDEKNREFHIYVAQCKDLAVVDEKKGRSDPYVKTYLLPDKARMGKRKTSVKRKTTNPIYNEVLRYKIEKMVLLIQKLNLSVWHNDPLGRNSFLGELEIDLTSWDWSNTKPNWYILKPRSLSAMNGVDHLGVMNLSIRYIPPGSIGPKNPSSGEVHIWVKDTKDLPQLRPSGVDSFVKCYVLPDTSKKSYQKTRVIKKDSNPVFNHTIVYDGFHTEDLKDACVELTVWDHEKLNNHFLGGIRLGLGTGFSYGIAVDWMDSTQEEVASWQEMMLTPNEWIEGSLPLRSLAGRRKFK
ncbi:PREDICTED: synaptotagmin-like protein 2 [Nanorana parkeri]|uniref:synaptotagmin-like protein 2 n=1 Tax=Nanorana parkeri TaxID=125878 RepID=UPI000853FAE1|nr:PREDICTED: synaptotagmin-like protein 2 [Nanorana parkeri]